MSVTHNGKAPQPLTKQLGPQVELTTEVIVDRVDANDRLKELGRSLAPYGSEYKGTIAIHYFTSGKTLASISHQIMTCEQMAWDEEISEQFMILGFTNATIRVREKFTKFKHKSLDPKDQRSTK